jgi:hypothetical protein
VQLVCQATLPLEPDPSTRVPEDLRNLLAALKHIYNISPTYPEALIARSCAPALISVARNEMDLFPKPLARAMVRQIDPERLLDAVKDVEGLDLTDVNIEYLLKSRWDSLDSRSLRAMEDLIRPEPFTQILQAYKDSLFSIWNVSGFIGGFARGIVDG